MFLKLSKVFIYLSLFSIVVVLTSTFFPFIGGKYYFFRVSIELALIFFLLYWAFQAPAGEVESRFREIVSRPFFLIVSAFVLIFLLASIFALDPNAAFWSNYERGDGGFQMIHYYLFFTLLIFLFKSWEDWRWVFYLSLIAAIAMILYGVLAQLEIVKTFVNPYRGNPPPGTWAKLVDGRFQGTLGNPSYVAPYLMFSVFYTLYLWFRKAWQNRWLQAVTFGGLTIIYLFFFFLSQTRGAILGLGAAILAFLIYLIFQSSGKVKRWTLIALSLVIILTSIAWANKDSSLVQKIPGSRVLEINFQNRDVQTRFWTWNSAWQGFKERPILGWGPENFSAVFDKYFDSRHYLAQGESETWFDRAHSIFFDYLAETGILGLLSYIGIFVIFYWQFFKRQKRLKSQSPPTFRLSLLNALVFSIPIGYIVQGLFLFDVLPIHLNLFVIFAFSHYLFQENYETHP